MGMDYLDLKDKERGKGKENCACGHQGCHS